ncbi:DUF2141 domain-containing protein [Lacinutrix iliipiscaria]|uniref:DUF2141 domain-containing protein n=1 Tax=Lacinutrix iliipiscaria TaxID=1230532 RepID=A0ABW5WSM2_9FLAO
MRTLALIITFILSSYLSQAQTETKGQTITVTINNVKNNNGKVIMSLHSADTFMKSEGLQNEVSTIEGNSVTVTFKDVLPGTYAIMAIHDENDNKQMDFENGMPKESYGMSNNPLSYGPPQFSEAKFEMTDEDASLIIRF